MKEQAIDILDQAPAFPAVRRVPASRPLQWLRGGWVDMMKHPGPSLVYGLIVTVGGWAMVTLAAPHAELFTSVIAGFVMVIPLLAAGIYELTRQSEAGEAPSFINSVKSLRRNASSIADYGIALLLAGILWERVAAVMFALSYGGDMGSVAHFVQEIFLSGKYIGVVLAWLISGAALAALVFSVTVVGMPMVIDRNSDVVTAMITSVKAVLVNLPAMAVWVSLIIGLSLFGVLTALVGLVVVMPLLGHATWCAYRDLVEPE